MGALRESVERHVGKPVATDPVLTPVQKVLAGQAGIQSIGPVMDVIAIHCQRKLAASDALTIALEILSRAKNHPSAPGRYVAAAIRKEPFIWQKYIDERGLAQ